MNLINYTENGSDYKVTDANIMYHKETPKEVIEVLEQARENRTRLTLDYGDAKTGRSWGEINDINGRMGQSTGEYKLPLLIHNSSSTGGGAILDHCIIKIMESNGKRVLYSHPKYKIAS